MSYDDDAPVEYTLDICYDWAQLMDKKKNATLKTVGLVPFHFTRGCPFKCTYCSNIGIAQVYGKTRNNIKPFT